MEQGGKIRPEDATNIQELSEYDNSVLSVKTENEVKIMESLGTQIKKLSKQYDIPSSQIPTFVNPGEFIINRRLVRLTESSLICGLKNKNKCRQAMVKLSYRSYFDRFIIACILCNAVLMAIYNYDSEARCVAESKSHLCSFDHHSFYNKVLNIIGNAFGVIFVCEAIVKIIAMGFVMNKGTYLRSAWNALDFVIVLGSIIELLTVLSNITTINLKIIRTLRLLRPLKAFKQVPSLRKQIQTLFGSIIGLANVAIFLAGIFLLFGIVGLQLFTGGTDFACRFGPKPQIIGYNTTWPKLYTTDSQYAEYSGVCTPAKNWRYPENLVKYELCPGNFTCASALNEGMWRHTENLLSNGDIQFGFCDFSHIGHALLGVFQIISLDSWSTVLYNLQKYETSPALPNFFCISLIFLGTFFLLNLMLAVIMESYVLGEQKELENSESMLEMEQEELNKRLKLLEENFQESTNQEIRRMSAYPDVITVSSLVESEQNKRFKRFQERMRFGIMKKYKNLRELTEERQEELEDLNSMIVTIKDSEIEQLSRQIEANTRKAVLETDEDRQQNIQEQIEIRKELMLIKVKDQQIQDIHNNREQLTDATGNFVSGQIRSKMMPRKSLIGGNTNQIRRKSLISATLLINPEKDKPKAEVAQEASQGSVFKDGIRKMLAKKMQQMDHMEGLEKLVLDVMINNQQEGEDVQTKKEGFELTSKNHINAIADRSVQIIEHEKRAQRAQKNKLVRCCLSTADSRAFILFITLCIFLNIIVLSLNAYPEHHHNDTIIEWINIVFVLIFVVEVIVKLIGYGCYSYFSDKGSFFDFIIILASLIDLAVSIHDANGRILTVMRIFRVLRIFKLSSNWPQMSFFVRTMSNTLSKIGSFALILFVFIFIYAVMGVEAFGHKLRYDYDNNPVKYFSYDRAVTSDKFSLPQNHFDSVFDAFISVYIVLANDGWTTIYFDCYRAVGPYISSLFFLSLVVLGQQILFNLFLSILLKEFDDYGLVEEEKPQGEKKMYNYQRIWLQLKDFLVEESENQILSVENKSLCVFSTNNSFRKYMTRMVKSQTFDVIILVIIFISCFLLALDNPLYDPNGNLMTFILYVDRFTSLLFLIEIIIKVIAFGLICNGRQSYLRNSHNIMDFVIVVSSFVAISNRFNVNSQHFNFVKIMRSIRLLRPLKLISRNKNLTLSMKALIMSVPSILSLLVIPTLLMFIFGIVGVQLFKGTGFYCDTSTIVSLSQKEIESVIVTKEDCLNYGGLWQKKFTNFDNVWTSMLQMVVISQLVNWATIMSVVVNSNGPDLVPGFKTDWYQLNSLVFVFITLFGGFFIMNLFVGVVISAFKREQDNLGNDFILTDEQKEFMQQKLVIMNISPKTAFVRPRHNRFRIFCYDVATNAKFEVFIMVVILLNMLLLMTVYAGMSPTVSYVHQIANYVLTSIFVAEALIKICAFECRYFKDKWNVFDLTLVILSVASYISELTTGKSLGHTASLLARTLKMGRLVKLMNSLKRMQIIYFTFMNTFSSMMNVGGLMFLIIYIYAIFGMNFFADIKMSGPMNERLSFMSVFTSFVTLIRVTTGENWNELMNALSKQNSQGHSCIENPTYADLKANFYSQVGCGKPVIAYLFFGSYLVMLTLVFLNLFIAIILNGYFETVDKSQQYVDQDLIEVFKDSWSKFDPTATGFIPIKDVKEFLFELDAPLGWNESFKDNEVKQESFLHLCSMILPKIDSTELMFTDVLECLIMLMIIREEQNRAHQELVSQSSMSSKSSDTRFNLQERVLAKKLQEMKEASQKEDSALVKEVSKLEKKKTKKRSMSIQKTAISNKASKVENRINSLIQSELEREEKEGKNFTVQISEQDPIDQEISQLEADLEEAIRDKPTSSASPPSKLRRQALHM